MADVAGSEGGGLFAYLCEHGDRVSPESNAEAPTKGKTRMTESAGSPSTSSSVYYHMLGVLR